MRERQYKIGPGAASLILIVVVLSMSVLGVLALFSAQADRALAERGAQMAKDYYEAEALIEADIAALGENPAGDLVTLTRDAGEGREITATLALGEDGYTVVSRTLGGEGGWDESSDGEVMEWN